MERFGEMNTLESGKCGINFTPDKSILSVNFAFSPFPRSFFCIPSDAFCYAPLWRVPRRCFPVVFKHTSLFRSCDFTIATGFNLMMDDHEFLRILNIINRTVALNICHVTHREL